MNLTKMLVAIAATVASLGANALTASTSTVSGSFLTLAGDATTHLGTLSNGGTTVATITGGAVLSSDFPTADMNAFGTPFGGTFLSTGPAATSPSTVSFSAPTSFVSFLWGSPDTYNTLTVNTSSGSYSFVPGGVGGLSFSSTNGSQSYAQYVGFTAAANETITSLRFASSGNAFEAANFSFTSPVPEPETYALMLGGLGLLAFVARRRRAV